MNRKLKMTLAGAALLAAVPLAGCDDQQTAENIAQIQQATTLACSFVPTAASVAAILAALYPPAQVPVGAATAVAQQICDAVTAKSAARRGAALAPTVAGVVVEGHFTYGRHR